MSGKINFVITPGRNLSGSIKVPGDKSISHRSIMLGSLSEGITKVSGFLSGEDTTATLRAFKEMGVLIDEHERVGHVVVPKVHSARPNPA